MVSGSETQSYNNPNNKTEQLTISRIAYCIFPVKKKEEKHRAPQRTYNSVLVFWTVDDLSYFFRCETDQTSERPIWWEVSLQEKQNS